MRLFFLTIGAIFSSYRGLIVGVHRLFLRSFFFPRVCPGADYLLRYLFFLRVDFFSSSPAPSNIIYPHLSLDTTVPAVSVVRSVLLFSWPRSFFFLNIPLHFLRILLFFFFEWYFRSLVFSSFTGFYSVLLSSTRSYWVLLSFTGFY